MDTKSLLGRKKKATNTTNNLYKLKFYCDLCKKQLRDSNGLKQHNTTPLHRKNELVSGVDNNNKDEQLMFEFLRYLKNNGGLSAFQEVNKVYNAFILREKNHTHMVSTNINNLSVLMKRIINMDKTTKEKIFAGKYECVVKKPDNDMIEEGEYSRYLIKLDVVEGEIIPETISKNDKLAQERELLLKNQPFVQDAPTQSIKFKKKISIKTLKRK